MYRRIDERHATEGCPGKPADVFGIGATLYSLLFGVPIALLAAMATMVFANVALRFLTDHSILWVEEASRYAMVWLTFIGAGPVLRYGGHIGIDALQ